MFCIWRHGNCHIEFGTNSGSVQLYDNQFISNERIVNPIWPLSAHLHISLNVSTNRCKLNRVHYSQKTQFTFDSFVSCRYHLWFFIINLVCWWCSYQKHTQKKNKLLHKQICTSLIKTTNFMTSLKATTI